MTSLWPRVAIVSLVLGLVLPASPSVARQVSTLEVVGLATLSHLAATFTRDGAAASIYLRGTISS